MAKIEEIITPRGMLRRMATVVSDDEQINKLARSAYGGNTAIIIQKNRRVMFRYLLINTMD